MEDDLDDSRDGILDDDPALDCILYQELNKEGRPPRPSGKNGCFGTVLLVLLPTIGLVCWYNFK